MHCKNKLPIFVPEQHMAEFEKLSKAALMDIVWDYAMRTAGEDQDPGVIMSEFRQTRDIIVGYRNGKGL